MSDYRDKVSIAATIESYWQAFNKMMDLCPHVEPLANEGNARTILPKVWRPSFCTNHLSLLPHCTAVRVRYEPLFDISTPRVILKNYTIWRERFVTVSCRIDFPIDIFAWDAARMECSEYDDDGHCVGETKDVPAQMKPWCPPQFLTLEVLDSIWGKAWSLKDWHTKQEEIYQFGEQFSADVQQKYNEGILKASQEVARWEEAIEDIQEMKIPREVQ